MDNKSFAEYQESAATWITLAPGAHYPDQIADALATYMPVIQAFIDLVSEATSSTGLLNSIMSSKDQWMRIQLCRVFKKYVSPQTPVEMLKIRAKTASVIAEFGQNFRDISDVKESLTTRPIPDEALCMILWEYKDRGKKGYDLSEQTIEAFRAMDSGFIVTGPERAGRDIRLGDILPNYTKPDRPVDFVIQKDGAYIAIGLIRYDSDRGGAQEDDRTGQYREVAQEFHAYAATNPALCRTKLIFVNDGPGLLLGSMWADYAYLENHIPGKIKVVTLKMIPERISQVWLAS